MNRRKTLIAMAGLCGAGLMEAAFGSPKAPSPAAAAPATGGSDGGSACSEFKMDPLSKALKDDLDALGARQYSEEGVAVFLYCEDMVAAKAGKPSAPPNELSAKIASGLQQNGPAWQHLFPVAPAGDVNKLVEVLAVRDFNKDRLEQRS